MTAIFQPHWRHSHPRFARSTYCICILVLTSHCLSALVVNKIEHSGLDYTIAPHELKVFAQEDGLCIVVARRLIYRSRKHSPEQLPSIHFWFSIHGEINRDSFSLKEMDENFRCIGAESAESLLVTKVSDHIIFPEIDQAIMEEPGELSSRSFLIADMNFSDSRIDRAWKVQRTYRYFDDYYLLQLNDGRYLSLNITDGPSIRDSEPYSAIRGDAKITEVQLVSFQAPRAALVTMETANEDEYYSRGSPASFLVSLPDQFVPMHPSLFISAAHDEKLRPQYYALALLLPFTLALDIPTAPFQIIALMNAPAKPTCLGG